VCSAALGFLDTEFARTQLAVIRRILAGGRYRGCGPVENPFLFSLPELPAGEPYRVPILAPRDPNKKIGPAGFGADHFIADGTLLSYRVNFENDDEATAPTQRVVVTDQLDADLDWSTLQFTEFGFGDHQFALAAGQQYFQTTLPLTIEGRSLEV